MYQTLSTALNKQVQILRLKDQNGNLTWQSVRTVWASVTEDIRKNIFSDVGIGVRGATVVIRPVQGLTLHDALRWGDQFLFITSMIPSDNGDRLELKVAYCHPDTCQSDLDQSVPGPEFPGILTERYVGHDQLNPLAVVTSDMVLVTPKRITLQPGSWVSHAGRIYEVLVPHELDEWKNEYEVRRKEDC